MSPNAVSAPPAPPELNAEEAVAAFVQGRNAERRNLTAGQQAMGRALMLAAQGKRKNGRWAYGTNSQDIASSRGEQESLRRAGVVLDTAARAAALGPDFADYATLPGQVRDFSHLRMGRMGHHDAQSRGQVPTTPDALSPPYRPLRAPHGASEEL